MLWGSEFMTSIVKWIRRTFLWILWILGEFLFLWHSLSFNRVCFLSGSEHPFQWAFDYFPPFSSLFLSPNAPLLFLIFFYFSLSDNYFSCFFSSFKWLLFTIPFSCMTAVMRCMTVGLWPSGIFSFLRFCSLVIHSLIHYRLVTRT